MVKWLLPTPIRVFEWGTGRIQADLNAARRQIQVLAAAVEESCRQAQARQAEWRECQQQQQALLDEQRAKAGQAAEAHKQLAEIAPVLAEMRRHLLAMKGEEDSRRRLLAEISWGQVFNSAIADSAWLKDRSFSPGRWAVGYPGLYLLYRILNDVRPRRILELGLGESTKMMAQYAAARADAIHAVVEHDERWLALFKERVAAFTGRTEIVRLDMVTKTYRDDSEVIVYDRFAEAMAGRKFDFVLIDGPIGGEAKTYARTDIVDLLPEILADSFALVMDDYGRKGEQNTAMLIRARLQERNIPFCEAIYSGMKDVWLICSADLGFLRSL